MFCYCQDFIFFYYFGFLFVGFLVIIDIDEDKEIIFGDELIIDYIVWMGIQFILKEKSEWVGVDIIMFLVDIVSYLYKVVQKGQVIYYLLFYCVEYKLKLMDWLGVFFVCQEGLVLFICVVIVQCNYKLVEEIVEIEKVCDIMVDMYIMVMKILCFGMCEWEVLVVMEVVVYVVGGDFLFVIIVMVNGQMFYNYYYGNIVKLGDLFLIDVGVEMEMGYVGDMLFIVFVDKKFIWCQCEVYEIQNVMYLELVKVFCLGIFYMDVYDLLVCVMVEGLKGFGLMKGNVEDVVCEGVYVLFYFYGLGYMMGFDVYDMENLGEFWVGYNGQFKSMQFGCKLQCLVILLELGFVYIVELGIYFIFELIDFWKGQKKFIDFINYDKVEIYKDFGGICNEEDYLIIEIGVCCLGKKILLILDEVEVLRQFFFFYQLKYY